jgi:hypothetical protein
VCRWFILTCSNSLLVDQLKAQLQSEFAMTNLNLITRYLGVQFHCTSHGLLLQQTAYAHSILALTNMEDSRPTLVPYQDGIILRHFMGSLLVNATLYRQLMGKLLYLTRTHLDLAHVVGLVSRYMQALEESHMAAVKAIMCYLCHYPSTGLYFCWGGGKQSTGFFQHWFCPCSWWSNFHWCLYICSRHNIGLVEFQETNGYSSF